MANHVLYRFFSSTGQLLYIGITMNPPQRFKAHQGDKDWWTEVSGITVESYPTREELACAERRAIKVERPAYNKVHNSRSKLASMASSSPKAESLSQIKYVCVSCKSTVHPGTGYLQVDQGLIRKCIDELQELRNVQQLDGFISGQKLLEFGKPAPWAAWHRDCDPWPGSDDYWLDVGQVDTWQKLLATTAHLMGKSWLQYSDWDKFLYCQLANSGMNYDGTIKSGA